MPKPPRSSKYDQEKPKPRERGTVRKLPAKPASDPAGPRSLPLEEKLLPVNYVALADEAMRVWDGRKKSKQPEEVTPAPATRKTK